MESVSHDRRENAIDNLLTRIAQLAGAGKTKLVSTVIDDLLPRYSDLSNKALVCFYCDRNVADFRTVESIMNSIIRQLATSITGDPILHPVLELYQEKEKNAFILGKPTFEESVKALLDLLPSHQQITIIVDALDECEQQTRGKLV